MTNSTKNDCIKCEKLKEFYDEAKNKGNGVGDIMSYIESKMDECLKTCSKAHTASVDQAISTVSYVFPKSDSNVVHPNHYNGKYECIDVMKDVFGEEAIKEFYVMNAFKYLWRFKKKNGEEDLKKAYNYLGMYFS